MSIKKKHTKHSTYKKQPNTVLNAEPVKTFNMSAEQIQLARLGIISISPLSWIGIPKVPK